MEIFEVIKEYPLYSISTEGRVMKNSTRKIMKPSLKPNGYMGINLFTSDGRRKKELVHRLVALTFIPNDKQLPQVNHIDRVRDNNCVDNLEWVTAKENMDKSSLPVKIRVRSMKSDFVAEFDSIREACKNLSLTESNVSECLRRGGRQKTHRGYTFESI